MHPSALSLAAALTAVFMAVLTLTSASPATGPAGTTLPARSAHGAPPASVGAAMAAAHGVDVVGGNRFVGVGTWRISYEISN